MTWDLYAKINVSDRVELVVSIVVRAVLSKIALGFSNYCTCHLDRCRFEPPATSFTYNVSKEIRNELACTSVFSPSARWRSVKYMQQRSVYGLVKSSISFRKQAKILSCKPWVSGRARVFQFWDDTQLTKLAYSDYSSTYKCLLHIILRRWSPLDFSEEICANITMVSLWMDENHVQARTVWNNANSKCPTNVRTLSQPHLDCWFVHCLLHVTGSSLFNLSTYNP